MSEFQALRVLAAALLLALTIGQLPVILAACCAPADLTGLGTVWFVNDFAQYESALRQGAEQPGWLIRDPFTAEPHMPAFMFPLYVGLGKLGALIGTPPELLERLIEPLARGLMVLALWRFCFAFAHGRAAALAAVLLALFGAGFEVLAVPLGMYAGNWSYELNTFGLLFAAPHVPLAMAATLELARAWLRPADPVSNAKLVWAALLGAAVACLHPFHVPVLLAAMLGAGVVFWRVGYGTFTLAGAIAAALGAVLMLALIVSPFSFDAFWSATYGAQNQLPSPAPHELVIDLGITLVLAALGAAALRDRIASFGLLLWLMLALVAMYAPVPFQRRLGFGVQPMLAVVAGNALVAACQALRPREAAWLRLAVVALAVSSTAVVLVSTVASTLTNTPVAVYRSTPDLDAAARWLDERAAPGEVILGDWSVMNYLAPRTRAQVYGGHPVATLHASTKQLAVASVFSHGSSREVARQLGANWLVFGPAQATQVAPHDPAFQSGPVKVYRLTP